MMRGLSDTAFYAGQLSSHLKARCPGGLLWWIYIGVVIGFGLMMVFAWRQHIPFSHFTADPASIHHVNPLAGIVSNVGILLWSASAALLLFAGFAIWQQAPAQGEWLVATGAFTVLLTVDDLFMLHEYVVPIMLGAGHLFLYGVYALLAAFYLWRYWRCLVVPQHQCLWMFGLLFGGSNLMDIFMAQTPIEYLFEDGLKFLAIVTLLYFSATTAQRLLTGPLPGRAGFDNNGIS